MTTNEEFDKFLKQFHKLSDRHILVAKPICPVLIYKR